MGNCALGNTRNQQQSNNQLGAKNLAYLQAQYKNNKFIKNKGSNSQQFESQISMSQISTLNQTNQWIYGEQINIKQIETEHLFQDKTFQFSNEMQEISLELREDLLDQEYQNLNSNLNFVSKKSIQINQTLDNSQIFGQGQNVLRFCLNLFVCLNLFYTCKEIDNKTQCNILKQKQLMNIDQNHLNFFTNKQPIIVQLKTMVAYQENDNYKFEFNFEYLQTDFNKSINYFQNKIQFINNKSILYFHLFIKQTTQQSLYMQCNDSNIFNSTDLYLMKQYQSVLAFQYFIFLDKEQQKSIINIFNDIFQEAQPTDKIQNLNDISQKIASNKIMQSQNYQVKYFDFESIDLNDAIEPQPNSYYNKMENIAVYFKNINNKYNDGNLIFFNKPQNIYEIKKIQKYILEQIKSNKNFNYQNYKNIKTSKSKIKSSQRISQFNNEYEMFRRIEGKDKVWAIFY